MTLAELADLRGSWQAAPPVHMAVAAYLGLAHEPPRRATKESMRELFGGHSE